MPPIVPPDPPVNSPRAARRRPKVQGVYLITNAVTRETYIGSTVDLARRWQTHRQNLKTGKRKNPRMQEAWDRDGADAFSCALVEAVPNEPDLADRELFHFERLHPAYNISATAFRPATGRQKTDDDDESRFFRSVIQRPDNCWEWTGRVTRRGNTDPTIQFITNKGALQARRWAYERFMGPLDSETYLRRACALDTCVNPVHMKAGPRLQDTCKHGHAMTPENTRLFIFKGYNARECRACKKATWRATRARKQAAKAAL